MVSVARRYDALNLVLFGGRRAATWRALLRRIEPSPSVQQVLDGALREDLPAAGLGLALEERLAGGRVRLLLAQSRLDATASS